MAESVFGRAVEQVRSGRSATDLAAELVDQLTEVEKLGLLDGDEEFWPGLESMLLDGYNRRPIVLGAVERLEIPGLRFSDGPRGVVVGASTAFPVSMARGATWDVELEEQVGQAIGRELRAQGANFFGGVCINLPRHPGWGRAQETYGEDPCLLGEMGAALVRGVQRHAMAVAKHFALNSMENARFSVDVTADDATLHEVFLAHFRRVVEQGVDAIMTSYNSVNGEWAGQNEYLITRILRQEWGFEGITVSDFIWGLRDPVKSLRAGLDVEEPFRQQRAPALPAALADGRCAWADVDAAVRRILTVQLRHEVRKESPEPSPDVVFCAEHRALARDVAARSVVLLRNEDIAGAPALPLDPAALRRVAVIGRLSDMPNTGDHGSSDVRSPEVVTVLAGLRAALAGVQVDHSSDDDPEAASALVSGADACVVVVGYSAADEGEYISGELFSQPALVATFPPSEGDPHATRLFQEMATREGQGIVGTQGPGGDRASVRLRAQDVALIRAAAQACPRTIVVIVAGAAVLIDDWVDQVPAVLFGWYAGSEGGHGLADVLLGRRDPGGRLPFSIPRREDHLPFFDRDATAITYDTWFGQRLLDRLGEPALFPLGFGLSYSRFELSDLSVAPAAGGWNIEVRVTDVGGRGGRHVVQVYGRPQPAAEGFATRLLLGFAAVEVGRGGSVRARIAASARPLHRWADGAFAPASSGAVLEVGACSGDSTALAVTVAVPSPA